MIGRRVKSPGFTLVEVLLAIGVLAVGLIGVLSMFPMALRSAEESRFDTQVALQAQTVMSDLRARNVLVTGSNEQVENALETLAAETTTAPKFLYYRSATLTSKGMEIVASAEEAEFAMLVRVSSAPDLLPTGYSVSLTFLDRSGLSYFQRESQEPINRTVLYALMPAPVLAP